MNLPNKAMVPMADVRKRRKKERVKLLRAWLYSTAGCLLAISLPALAQTHDAWTELGTISPAAAQPTAQGRALHALCPWNGKLYIGYGDYDQNTGPIVITSYDPSTGIFSNEWTARSESIERFRPLMGRLYAPAIDPIRTRDPGLLICDSTGQWSDIRIFMTHAYDIATLTGSDLWLVGSRDAKAVALRSLDGGATWEKSLEIQIHPETNRFYYAGVLNNKLYVQCNADTNSMVFDGAGWTPGPFIARSASQSDVFANQLVAINRRWNLVTFDGMNRATPVYSNYPVRAFCVSGPVLYALDAREQHIVETRDLTNWSFVTTAPSNAYRLAVLAGKLYAATWNSTLCKFNRPLTMEASTRDSHNVESEQAGAEPPPQGVGSPDP